MSETVITRPFHSGIVVIVGDDWRGEPGTPAFDPDRMVAANDFAVTIAVRHAQDTDEVETGDDGVEYVKFAAATVVVRLLDSSPTDVGRREVFSGVIAVRTGRLTVGDADEETIVTAHARDNRVIAQSATRYPPTTSRPTSSTWTFSLRSTSGRE